MATLEHLYSDIRNLIGKILDIPSRLNLLDLLEQLATMCIADSGNRARTCCGPVKSSCVNSGKMTKPTLKSDMLGLHSS